LLEFSNVFAQGMVRPHHRPDVGDFGFPHVEHAGADRGQQPFMQRSAVVIAVEILLAEGKLCEGVRAVDDDLYSAGASQLTDLLYGKNLAGSVGDVAYMDDLRLRREVFFDAVGEKIETGGRDWKLDLLQYNAVAPLALQPGGNHARIVLVGRHDFIARFQGQAKLNDLEGLAGIARDGNLLRVAAERTRQAPAYCFKPRIEDFPHVV